MPTLAYILSLYYALKTQLIFSYNFKNLYSPRLSYVFLWRKIIESTVRLRSLMARPAALNTLSLLLLLARMHSTDLANFASFG